MSGATLADRIVMIVAQHPDGVSTIEIAQALGVDRLTISRQVAPMCRARRVSVKEIVPTRGRPYVLQAHVAPPLAPADRLSPAARAALRVLAHVSTPSAAAIAAQYNCSRTTAAQIWQELVEAGQVRV